MQHAGQCLGVRVTRRTEHIREDALVVLYVSFERLKLIGRRKGRLTLGRRPTGLLLLLLLLTVGLLLLHHPLLLLLDPAGVLLRIKILLCWCFGTLTGEGVGLGGGGEGTTAAGGQVGAVHNQIWRTVWREISEKEDKILNGLSIFKRN